MTPLFCLLQQKDHTSLDLQPITHTKINAVCFVGPGVSRRTPALQRASPLIRMEGEGCLFGERMFEVTLT